jgi:hypothetical protein
MHKLKETLQSLKVATGWKVDWHTFYDFEPVEEFINYFAGDSLFMATNLNAGLLVSLEWRPEADIKGEFVLRVIEVAKDSEEEGGYDYRWEAPLFVKRTKDKSQTVNMLDTLMVHGLNVLKQM